MAEIDKCQNPTYWVESHAPQPGHKPKYRPLRPCGECVACRERQRLAGLEAVKRA